MDEWIKKLSELPTEEYKYTEQAAKEFYQCGDVTKLIDASNRTGIPADVILALW